MRFGGFSTRSEKHSPEENFAWLNRYLEMIEPAIRGHNGFINQYYGDGILALFSKAEDALSASVDMLRLVEGAGDEFGDGEPLRIGIGLHTGPLILGTIGGQERLDVGVVGDAVNTAARIEALTKTFGHPLLFSQTTRSALSAARQDSVRPVDSVTPKGKRERIALFTIPL